MALRTAVADAVLKDTLAYLEKKEGDVAIFDATNTTRERRHSQDVLERWEEE